MREASKPTISPDAYALRNLVGRWLRIRAQHVHDSVGIVGGAPILGHGDQERLLLQLAADAEHSSLLVRLFKGEEPVPFEEWRDSGL